MYASPVSPFRDLLWSFAGIEFPLRVIGDGLTVTVASQSFKGGSHVHLSEFSQQLCPLPYKELGRSSNDGGPVPLFTSYIMCYSNNNSVNVIT